MSIFTASTSPHKKSRQTTRGIMLDVLIALAPATIAGCVFFGWKAVLVLAISVLSAVATEFVWLFIKGKTWKEIVKQFDFTSIVTGLLLGLCLHSETPWYVPMLSAIFAVGAVKMFFGGTGKNVVNPAIAGRVFAFIAFAAVASGYVLPAFTPDVVATSFNTVATGATPLTAMLSEGGVNYATNLQLFLGLGVAGCIGETCKAALLLGYIYLIVRKVIDFKFPILVIGFCGLTQVALSGFDFSLFLPSILSGGLFLGAIFMATDYVTSPKTQVGSIVYFIIMGVLIGVLRKATQIEVVSFAILFMNLTVPLIDRYIRPRPFGYTKPPKASKEGK